MPEPARQRPPRPPRPLNTADPLAARQLLREASLELARLRRIRGASHKTWRRIAKAKARLAFAAALLAALPAAQPAAAVEPRFRPPLIDLGVEVSGYVGMDFADLDGDGDLDLLTTGAGYGTRFFENTGTAAAPALAPAHTNPFGLTSCCNFFSISLADLDADGDLDVLIGRLNDSVYFENTGSAVAPAFAAPVTDPFGLSGTGVRELADLDGDGDLDAFSFTTSTTAFLENTGTVNAPAFTAPVTNAFGLTSRLGHFADLDGDGDLDALVSSGYHLSLVENTGSATAPAFGAPGTPPLFELPPVFDPELADLDGDGDFDVFVASRFQGEYDFWSTFENVGGPSAPVFTNRGNPFGFGTFDFYLQAGYAYPGDGASAALADIDGDDDLDGFVAADPRPFNPQSPLRHALAPPFLRNTGTASAPAFTPDRFPIDPLALSGNDPVLADLDGDGDSDALVGLDSGDLLWFENTGSASAPDFAPPATNAFGLANVGGYASPDLADLDGDGDLDAIVGNGYGEWLFFENTGSALAPAFAGAQTNPFGLSTPVGFAFVTPTLADLDGDGDLDAFAGISPGHVVLFANTGTANAPAFAAPVLNPFGLTDVGSYASPDFADIDGDGDLDAFVGRAQGGGVFFFRNTGTANAPAFANFVLNAFGLTSMPIVLNSAPDLADLDDDGDLDAVVANRSGVVTYFENVRDPTTPLFVSPENSSPFGVGLREADFVDIDADGDLDLFSGTTHTPFLVDTTFSENTGSASRPAFTSLVTQPFGLPNGGPFSAPSLADLDGDGDADALIGRSDGNLVFSPNTGSPSAPAFGTPTTNPFGLANVGSYATPELADVDGDGDLDALVGADDGNTRFFENTGSAAAPAFAAPQTNPFGLLDVGARSSPESADVDGDGDLDVLVGDQLQRVVFFENLVANPACDNGIDDDGDGLQDLADPGCSSATDASELSPPAAPWSCGLGPELLLLAPALAAARRGARPAGRLPRP